MCKVYTLEVNCYSSMGIGKLKMSRFHNISKRHRPFKMIWEDQEKEMIALTSPSCRELGIPLQDIDHSMLQLANNSENCLEDSQSIQRVFTLPCGKTVVVDKVLCEEYPKRQYFPVLTMSPFPFTEVGQERKRNERERERVRCVNEGYARLRRHLPVSEQDKRISKVDTLRSAIDYIKYLNNLLSNIDENEMNGNNVVAP